MKVAIAGYGVEGESNYRYFSANPNNTITIVDQRNPDLTIPTGVATIIDENAFSKLDDFDLVIRTAGLAPRKIKTKGRVWSATNEFFSKCPAKIIGVTGSKGKGTTASLIASILEAAGKKVWLLGNIGKPGLDVLDQISHDDIVVYELSSFQLWDIEKSPSIAVVLYIEQEHLDVHIDMNEYIGAKSNIAKFQSVDDVIIYNAENKYALDIAKLSSATYKIGYPNNASAHVREGKFYYGEQEICSINKLRILGKFNQMNACAAIDAIWQITSDINAVAKGVGAFTGLPHRLQFVRELDGVSYYDDSIATIPGAAIAAIKSFDMPKVVILGGSSKGSDFTDLAKSLVGTEVQAVLIGSEAHKISKALDVVGFNKYEIIEEPTMDKIVKRARELAVPGGVVLLSPAAASFGLFKNYTDRGNQFISAVNNLN
jgi:UDP-N-acetylmuramoylalanine--D-glutamate ligase